MSLKVWLPLNGTLENKGCSNYTITAIEASPVFTSGKIGQCYQRANSSSQLTNGLQLNSNLLDILGTQASVAVWVKPLGTHTHYNGTILSSGDWNRKRWAFGVSQDNSQVDVLCGAYNTYISCSVPANEWTHLVSTFDNGTCKLYKNGVYIGEKTGQAAFDTDATWTGIGRETYASGYFGFNGCINDLRIYNHVLSAAEVREISQGLVLHYKLDGFFGGAGENLVINGDARNGLTGWSNWGTATSRQVITIGTKKWFNFKTDPNGNYGGFSQDRGIALYKPNTQYTISALMYASANASGRLWVHTRSTEGGANLAQYLTTVNVTTSPALYTFTFNTGSNASYTINKLNLMIGAVSTTSALDFYISNIKVEEGTKATTWVPCKEEGGYDTTKVEDSSGYNHNGTITGDIQITSNSSKYSNCIYIPSGNTDYITTNDEIGNFSEGITTSIWFKSSNQTPGSSYHELFNIATATQNFEHAIYKTGYFRGGMVINGTRYVDNTDNTNLTDGNWHHIAMTYDGAILRRYVDGIDKKDTNVSGTLTSTSCKFLFGHYGTNTSYYAKEAYLSDVRIYCTALDANAIRQLYEVGAKIDNKQNLHTFELNEKGTGRELLAIPLTTPFNNRTNIYTAYNSNGEITLTGGSSIGSNYIPINPSGHTYYYDIDVSTDAGNVFYIGFERYDVNKTSRSNSACVYLTGLAGSSQERIHEHYHGTVNLATDGVNPTDTIALRILNDWSGANGRKGTVHSISLREVSTVAVSKITKHGQVLTDELSEMNNHCRFQKNGIIEANEIIEF